MPRKLKALQNDAENPILKVKEQNRIPFWETRGLRADIVVETADKKFVIDTKWKVLKDNKPSDSDLKQIFVYNLHYNTDLSILLYPKTSIDSAEKKPFINEKFKVYVFHEVLDGGCVVALVPCVEFVHV